VPPSLADIAARHIENAPGARMTGVGSADVFTSVCTLCPRGCALEIERDEQGGARISGAGCDRGEQDILSSLEHPLRAFTGSVRTDGAAAPLLPVRTSAPVPQEALMSIARQTRHLVAHPPIHAGDIIMEDVAGTGADLIATDDREEV